MLRLPRWLLVGVLLLVGLLVAGIAAAQYAGREVMPDDYNCLILHNTVQVQLNTHLQTPVFTQSMSLNGRYRFATFKKPGSYSRSVSFIEDTATGHRFDWHIMGYMPGVVWSPDSRLVAYTWSYNSKSDDWGRVFLATTNGQHIAQKELEAPAEFEFSPRGTYILQITRIAHDNSDIQMFAADDFPNGLAGSLYGVGSIRKWSPDGHHLVYANAEDQLMVFDLVTGGQSVIPLPDGIGAGQLTQIRFSPDGRYFAVAYDAADRYSAGVLPKIAIWRYDLDTLRSTLLTANILTMDLKADRLVTVRKPGGTILVETRAADGSNPVLVKRFDPGEVNFCKWYSTASKDFALLCGLSTRRGSSNTMLLTESGEVMWHFPPVYDDQGEIVWWKNDKVDSRFRVSVSSELNPVRIKLHDLKFGRIYEIPAAVVELLIAELSPVEISFNQWDFQAISSPDDQVWLVRFGPDAYRFYPARYAWDLIETRHPISNILLSPDGQRYAVATYDAYTTLGDLYVYETDQSRYWNLGMFPGSLLREMTWTHCGDILAPLRDHLAAKSLD